MTSLWKLEASLMAVGTGATGVSLFQDYGVRTPEMKYFIDYCRRTPVADLGADMAIAPDQVYLGFPERIAQAYQAVLDRLPCLDKDIPSKEELSGLRKIIEDFYTVLYEMYSTLKSGNVRLEQAASTIHT